MEQTEKVRQLKIARNKNNDQKMLGIVERTAHQRSRLVLQTLVARIVPCSVIVPFKNVLTSLLPRDDLQVRGHYDKLLSLAYLSGVLHQRQLPKLAGIPVLTAEKAYEILYISADAFSAMGSFESRVQKLVEAMHSKGMAKGSIIDKTGRIALGKHVNRHSRTVLTYLNFLQEEGHLSSTTSRREKVFELLVSPDEMAERFASFASNLQSKNRVIFELNFEARQYINQLCDKKGLEETEKEELLSHFPITMKL